MGKKYYDIDGNMKVFVVFNGEEYVFNNDVDLAGYLAQTCESKKNVEKDNGIFYADELGYVDAPQ